MIDHLHSDALSQGNNMEVFQKIYDTIGEVSDQQADLLIKAFAIEDEVTKIQLRTDVANKFFSTFLDLINETIETWEK